MPALRSASILGLPASYPNRERAERPERPTCAADFPIELAAALQAHLLLWQRRSHYLEHTGS